MKFVKDINFNEKKYKSAFSKIEKLMKPKGYSVIFLSKSGNWFCPYNKEFKISTAQTEEYMLYSLLHEVGHFLLYKRKSYKKKYGIGSSVINKQIVKTRKQSDRLTKKLSKRLQFRILCLKEEIDAWDAGLKFAKEHKLKINMKNYDHLRNMSLQSYCGWVYQPENASI